jgi:hypothetical protein
LAHLLGVRHQSLGGQRLDVRGNLGAVPGMPVGAASVLFVARLHVPGAVGIVGACPALGVVPTVAQGVEGLFVPWWGDI